MREASVERKLVTGIKKLGGFPLKFTSPGTVGVPDRLIIMPGGQIFFVELKTEVGRLSPIQQAVIARMRGYGCAVSVLYGQLDVEELLDGIKAVALSDGGFGLDRLTSICGPLFGHGPWENVNNSSSD